MNYTERQINQIVAETLLPFAQVKDVADRRGIPRGLLSQMRQQFFAGRRHLDPALLVTLHREREKVLESLARVAPVELASLFQNLYLTSRRPRDISVMAYSCGFESVRVFQKAMLDLRRDVLSDLRAHGITLLTEIMVPDNRRMKNFRERSASRVMAAEAQADRLRRMNGIPPALSKKIKKAFAAIGTYKASAHDIPDVTGLRRIDIPLAGIVSGASDRARDSLLRTAPEGNVSFFLTPDGRPVFARGSGMSLQEEMIEVRLFRAGRLSGPEFDHRARMRQRICAHLDMLFSDTRDRQEVIDFAENTRSRKSDLQVLIDRLIGIENRETIKRSLNQDLLAAIRQAMPGEDSLLAYRRISEMATPMRGRARPLSMDDPEADRIRWLCASRPLDAIAGTARNHPWVIRNLLEGHLSIEQASVPIDNLLSASGVRETMAEALAGLRRQVDFGRIPVLAVGRYAYPGIMARTTEGWERFAACVEVAEIFAARGEDRDSLRNQIAQADIAWDSMRIGVEPLYTAGLGSFREYLQTIEGRDVDATIAFPAVPGSHAPMTSLEPE